MYINRTKESYVQNVQKNDNNVVDEDLDNIHLGFARSEGRNHLKI